VPYRIEIDPQAVDDLKRMRAFERAAVLDVIDRILAAHPMRLGKSRIKRLRGLDSPQYRLRVDDLRVFYDVDGEDVYVLRILAKDQTDEYLREMGHEA
jgi:mRNA-degrading endonuclease RelE of RelBE toxin-antitoxin system